MKMGVYFIINFSLYKHSVNIRGTLFTKCTLATFGLGGEWSNKEKAKFLKFHAFWAKFSLKNNVPGQVVLTSHAKLRTFLQMDTVQETYRYMQ